MFKLNAYKSIMEIANEDGEKIVDSLKDRSPFSSGELEDSIQFEITTRDGNFVIDIGMVEWGIYQDEGVDGVLTKWGSRFTFRDKIPPVKAILPWVKREGIQFRGTRGRFLTHLATSFMVAHGIFKYGIEPRNWINPDNILDEQTEELSSTIRSSIWDAFEEDFKSKSNRNFK